MLGTYAALSKPSDVSPPLPAHFLQTNGFTLYYYANQPPGGYRLDERNSHNNGSLVTLRLANAEDSSIIITQQANRAFDQSTLQADEEFTTPYGKAYLTDGTTRTTATLFTRDGTWLLINAPSPIGAAPMKEIVSKLLPVAIQADTGRP